MDNTHIRQLTASKLESLGIPLNPNLPLLEHLKRRPIFDIVNRLVVEYALTGLANEASPKKLFSWIKEIGIKDATTSRDRHFLSKRPTGQQEIDLSWRKERLIALVWSGGIIESLPFPSRDDQLDSIFPLIPPEVELHSFRENFEPRSSEELSCALDFYLCLHSAYRHPEIWENQGRETLPISLIRERRTALEWICYRDLEIDDIALDT